MTELLHCKHCGQDKPPSEMRKDSSYASGYRPQCKACKQQADTSKTGTAKVTDISVAERKRQARREAEERRKARAMETPVFSCNRCGQDDIPYEKMAKDKRKAGGVGGMCLQCRREREAELKEQARIEASSDMDAEWVYCWKCDAKARPTALSQPPTTVPGMFPPGARLCRTCISQISGRPSELVNAERARRGLKPNASRKELESAARLGAVKQLIAEHPTEYRNFFYRQMSALGVEVERKWVSL